MFETWVGEIPWIRKPTGNPLQYSYLENPIDREDWWGYSPWGLKKLDMAEHLADTHTHTHTHTRICKLEPNREQTGSKLRKEFIKAVC